MRLLFRQGPFKGQEVDYVGDDAEIQSLIDTGFAEEVPEPEPVAEVSHVEKLEASREEPVEKAPEEIEEERPVIDTDSYLSLSVPALKRRLGGAVLYAEDLADLIAAELAGKNRDTAIRVLKQERDARVDQHATVDVETPEG